MNRIYQKFCTFVCLLAIAIGLSGCVEYRTGVNFYALNHGEIVQQIRLGEQLNSFSQDAVLTWTNSIENRVRKLSGQVKHLTNDTLQILIPFDNARDLATKFDRYFNFPSPADLAVSVGQDSAIEGVKSHLGINQNNFLILVRNHLIYDVDLRSLTVKSADPKVSIASGSDLDLSFSLQSPWGSKSSNKPGSLNAVKDVSDRETVWELQPGSINHIDAVFWLPNPLGIGGVIIIAISIAGYYLKYRQLPGLDRGKE